MGLFSDLITNVLGGTAKKPTVPTYTPTNVPAEQQATVAGNAGVLPATENLASQYNLFNQQQLTQMLQTAIPGYSAITSKASQNILDELSGKIPADVQGAIESSSAAKALTGGFGGSPLAGNLTARDLGLTSLNLMQQGLSSAESWTKMMDSMFAPGQFNVSSMFVSPQFTTGVTQSNTANQFGVEWLKNQLAAMPDPGQAAIAADLGQMGDFVGSGILNAIVPGLGNIPGLGSGGGGMGSGGGMNLRSMFNSLFGGAGGGAGATAADYAGTGFASGDLAGLIGMVG